jgi:hypothetical protein
MYIRINVKICTTKVLPDSVYTILSSDPGALVEAECFFKCKICL